MEKERKKMTGKNYSQGRLQWPLFIEKTGRQAGRQTERQAGRQAGRQTDRQTDRQAGRQRDRRTDRMNE